MQSVTTACHSSTTYPIPLAVAMHRVTRTKFMCNKDNRVVKKYPISNFGVVIKKNNVINLT